MADVKMASISWMTRDGSYGNGLSWYPAMNIAYVQCFNILKELNPDSPNQVLLTSNSIGEVMPQSDMGPGVYNWKLEILLSLQVYA